MVGSGGVGVRLVATCRPPSAVFPRVDLRAGPSGECLRLGFLLDSPSGDICLAQAADAIPRVARMTLFFSMLPRRSASYSLGSSLSDTCWLVFWQPGQNQSPVGIWWSCGDRQYRWYPWLHSSHKSILLSSSSRAHTWHAVSSSREEYSLSSALCGQPSSGVAAASCRDPDGPPIGASPTRVSLCREGGVAGASRELR